MNLTNLSLRLNGYDIASAKRKLQELNLEVNTDYPDYLERQKTEILKYHLNSNPFYKNITSESTKDWESLPVLTKSDLQHPLRTRLSTPFSKRNCHVHKTSGSSGAPFVFAKDKFAHALTWASVQDVYAAQGIDLNQSYEARFYGIAQSGMPYYKERLKDALSNRCRFAIFDTEEANFEGFVKRFKKTRFGHLNGYTSTLVLFARYLKSKSYQLKDLCPTLTHCIVTAEMLFKKDLELLETQFGVPIFNEYGSSETGIIAFGHARDSLKIDARLLYVEILDESNVPVPAGTEGKIVITSLFNKAYPFIRYEIGDQGILNFENKLPVLSKLKGRIGDFAILPDGKKIPALAFYYVTKEIINDTGNVKEFTIIQNLPDSFTINYVADQAFTEIETKKILQAIANYLGENLSIIFSKKPFLDRSKRGKLRQFRRAF